MKKIVDGLNYGLDTLRVSRRASVWVSLYLVVFVTMEAWDFALKSPFDGVGTAAVIGAITAPLSWLVKGAIDAHHQGHKDDKRQ